MVFSLSLLINMQDSKPLDPTRTYFSRAGKASLSKFKILKDREKILKGEKIVSSFQRYKSEPTLPEPQIGKMISEEIEALKMVRAK